MVEVPPIPSLSDIEQKACQWVAKLDRGDLSPEDTRALHQWLNEHPAHARVFSEIASLDDSLSVLSFLAPLFPLKDVSTTSSISSFLQRLAGKWLPVRCLAAFLLLGVALSAALWLQDAPAPDSYESQRVAEGVFTTEAGENRRVELSDGSSVLLNSQSRVNVAFEENWRALTLQYGEAQFEVAADANRPFVVRAGGHVVIALGTAFNVRLESGHVELTVTHGAVAVEHIGNETAATKQWPDFAGSGRSSDGSRVIAGEVAMLDKLQPAKIRRILPDEVDKKLAWQKGEIVFSGESLEAVIDEVNRYTKTPIRIVDDAIRDIPVGGRFKTGEVLDLLDILEHGFGIKARRTADNEIVLSRHMPPPAQSPD